MIRNVLILLLVVALGAETLLLLQVMAAPREAATTALVASATGTGEIELALQESYLDRQIRDRVAAVPGGTALRDLKLDLRPGNQAQIRGTTVALGLTVPITVDLSLGLERGAIRATVTGGRAGPVDLPAGIRRETEAAVNDAIARSFRLDNTGLELSGLRTTDAAVTLTLRERP